jgi:hypothetical protein
MVLFGLGMDWLLMLTFFRIILFLATVVTTTPDLSPTGEHTSIFFWLNNLMKFYRWADMNVSRPIPKSPGVQCGGGLGYLLTYIENLILGFLFPIFFTFVVYVC